MKAGVRYRGIDMDNVTKLYPLNASDNPDNVLEQAIGEYNDVMVIGWDKNDELDVRCSTALIPKKELIWLMDLFKHKLMNGDYD